MKTKKLYVIITPEMLREWTVMASCKHDAINQFLKRKPDYKKPKMTDVFVCQID